MGLFSKIFGKDDQSKESEMPPASGQSSAREDRILQADATDWFQKGEKYLEQENYDNSIAAYTSAISMKPDYVEAYFKRGQTYYIRQEIGKALSDLEYALSLNPKHTGSLLVRGLIYVNEQDYDKIIDSFSRLITAAPNSDLCVIAYPQRGFAYRQKEQFDKAISDFNKALSFNSNDEIVYFERGLAYATKKDFQSAINDFSKAISLKPDYPEVYRMRGLTYIEMQKFESGLRDLKTACDLGDEEASVIFKELNQSDVNYVGEVDDSSVSTIVPINGPSNYCFKLEELDSVKLTDWPPHGAEIESRVVMELSRHWPDLSSKVVWVSYPIFSYCLGWAEERDGLIRGQYFLFPMTSAKYQGQALAQVMCEINIGAPPGEFKAWVDALRENELDEHNRRELKDAIENHNIKETLVKLVGRKCSFVDRNFEIKNSSDMELIDVKGAYIFIKHTSGNVIKQPVWEIDSIRDNSSCLACGSNCESYHCEICNRYWCISISCPNADSVKYKGGQYVQITDFSICQKCGRKGKAR